MKHLSYSVLILGAGLVAANPSPGQQLGDPDYRPAVERPSFPGRDGPLVAIDEGHHNFHTRAGRYAAFAALLEADGYRVRSHRGRVEGESLVGTRVLVVANALHESNARKWELPTPSAFTGDEIDRLVAFVEGGGGLFLIADHMPFPGAADALASRFGVEFENGFNFEEDTGGLKPGPTVFRRKEGGIAPHAITDGFGPGAKIGAVATFTGSAFRLVRPGDQGHPLLLLAEGSVIVSPRVAWKFTPDSRRRDASGWLQGAAIEHGKGRVVVFAEAAMFTAQRRPDGTRIGMHSPAAEDNEQLALNILHWLSAPPVAARATP